MAVTFSTLPSELKTRMTEFFDIEAAANYASTSSNAPQELFARSMSAIALSHKVYDMNRRAIVQHVVIISDTHGIKVGFPDLSVTIRRAINIYNHVSNTPQLEIQTLNDPFAEKYIPFLGVDSENNHHILTIDVNSESSLATATFQRGYIYLDKSDMPFLFRPRERLI